MLECVTQTKYENFYLYNEALCQQCNIEYGVSQDGNNSNAGNIIANLSTEDDFLPGVKTPDNTNKSFLRDLVKLDKSPVTKPVKKYARKAIKFEEESATAAKSQRATKLKKNPPKTPFKAPMLKDILKDNPLLVPPKTPKPTDFDGKYSPVNVN